MSTNTKKLRVNFNALLQEKEAAEERHIPLQEVATETGLSYLTLNKLRKPDAKGCQVSTLEVLCAYFDKPVEQVLVEVNDTN